MKLAQGEYVALENIESIYGGSALVAQLYVHGDSLQSYLIGVAVPDPVQFAALVSRVRGKPVSPDDVAALGEATKDPQIVTAFLAELQKQAKKHQLKGYVSRPPLRLVLALFSLTRSLIGMQFRAAEADPFDPRAFLYRERLPDADPEDPEVRSAAVRSRTQMEQTLTVNLLAAALLVFGFGGFAGRRRTSSSRDRSTRCTRSASPAAMDRPDFRCRRMLFRGLEHLKGALGYRRTL